MWILPRLSYVTVKLSAAILRLLKLCFALARLGVKALARARAGITNWTGRKLHENPLPQRFPIQLSIQLNMSKLVKYLALVKDT